MIEQIISRGIVGPELAALSIAVLCGLPTGGHTHHAPRQRLRQIVRRYDLSADSTSHWAAMWRNIRQADGTMIVGDIGLELWTRIEADGKPVFPLIRFPTNSAKWLVEWVVRHQIRTLNIVGETSAALAGETCELLSELLVAFDNLPRYSEPIEGYGFGNGRSFYSAVVWPTQRVWRWKMVSARWQPYSRWKRIQRLREGAKGNLEPLWSTLPPHIGPFVVSLSATALDELVALSDLGKAADDLARSGRWALLRLVARVYALRGSEAAPRLRLLLQRRQRDILRGFGFPGTESSVRILAKLSRGACSMSTIRSLRTLMHFDPPTAKLLSRLPGINTQVMQVIADPWLRRVLSPRCLWELSHEWDDDFGPFKSQTALSSVLAGLQVEAARTGMTDAIERINSLKQLHRVLMNLYAMPSSVWPSPPAALVGIAGLIEPLATPVALVEEGCAMHHCVETLADAVARGESLLFRIHGNAAAATDRATLELRGGPDGQWHISQLLGPRNRSVSEKTLEMVEAWRVRAHVAVEAAMECSPSEIP